jgi:hypothetical protein
MAIAARRSRARSCHSASVARAAQYPRPEGNYIEPELDTAIFEYRSKHPPAPICEPDEPDGRTKTYKFKFTAPFPDSWTHLPIEILEATRSALDQCAYAAAKLSGNKRLKRTQFPIADSLDDLNNLITGR